MRVGRRAVLPLLLQYCHGGLHGCSCVLLSDAAAAVEWLRKRERKRVGEWKMEKKRLGKVTVCRDGGYYSTNLVRIVRLIMQQRVNARW